jgi:hypothetical protein
MPETTEIDFEEYLNLVAGAYAGGFSKGTADVSPRDIKKLRPLLNYYSKKAHPFTACVRDNRKRFGPLTEKYCAVVKDLIEGNTKWRKGGKKHLADMTVEERDDLMLESLDRPLAMFLSESDETEIQEFVDGLPEIDQVSFAGGDVVWKANEGFSELRREVERTLQMAYPTQNSDGTVASYSNYYVEDISDGKALVCAQNEYYVIPFTRNGEVVELAQQDQWTPVARAWVEENLSLSEASCMAEIFFEDGEAEEADDDGYVWKTVLREGTWAFSPGQGQEPVKKPITITRFGKSDASKLTISMNEIAKNFREGAKDHVTIPTSHADKVTENTGFVRDVRFKKDANNRWVMQAAHDFTEPDVKEKALRGTIANTSAGVLFDYVNKESGKKYGAVLGHVALTNSPWLNGMEPFGMSEDAAPMVLTFSENPINEGGIEMPETTEVEGTPTPTFEEQLAERLGLSEDQIREALAERESQKEETRKRNVTDQVKAWEDAGRTPALVKVAKDILMSDKEGTPVLNLSEEGQTVKLSASDIVKRLMDAVPGVTLSEDVVTDKDQAGGKPADTDETVELSQDQKTAANRLWLSGEANSFADAVAAVTAPAAATA